MKAKISGHRPIHRLGLTALAAILMLSLPACNNSLGGFGGAVGNTPNTAAGLTFFFTGTAGEPFTATVADATSKWQLQGVTPFRVVLCNNTQPGAVQATKTASDTNSFEVQIFRNIHKVATASTTAPFGNLSATSKKNFMVGSQPNANPDVRFFVSGPEGEHFNGLVEDLSVGFSIDSVAPAVFAFEHPNGKVDAQFCQVQNFGPFSVNLTVGGNVVATANGGPCVTIVEP